MQAKQTSLFSAPEPAAEPSPYMVPTAHVLDGAPIGAFQLNHVYHQDCLQALRTLPDKSFDVALVDPPYNASKGGEWKWDNSVVLPGMGGDWTKAMLAWDDMSLAQYLAFTLEWLREIKRIVKPTGSVWVHGTYHNIGIINVGMQLSGIEIINEVVWFKRNSFPNLSGRRLTASHETILWAHTGGAKRQYLFNYETAKALPCPEDQIKVEGRQMRTVWDIPNNKDRSELAFGRHPTQKPLRLLHRMLALSAKVGDVCLIPFAGSGSECVAALQRGLSFLAFERESEYYAIASQRISSAANAITQGTGRASLATALDTAASTGRSPTLITRARGSALVRSSLKRVNDSDPVPSLIKWTGSKRSQVKAILPLVPSHKRYFEPFLGGGALLYHCATPNALATDTYAPLIALWRLVQTSPDDLTSNYDEQWRLLQRNLPDYFYEVRSRFNTTQDPRDLNLLLRTCVNGIVRFNDAGQFNNSFHLSRPGMNPRLFRSNVLKWHDRLKEVVFRVCDYQVALEEAVTGDFAYLDPPYAGTKQRYQQETDFQRLLLTLERLNERGVLWALSFDGLRGDTDLSQPVPPELYKRATLVKSGNSPVHKVLNGPIEVVQETLYLSF